MFNRKLKEEVKRLKEEIKEKDRYISTLSKKIEAIEEFESNMPEDCVYGDYCELCQFVKVFRVSTSYDMFTSKSYEKVYVCGKGKACPNFVKKSHAEEEE